MQLTHAMTYPATIRIRAEAELPPAVAEAARRERMTSSEFLRRAAREAVVRAGDALAPACGNGARGVPLPLRDGVGRD